MDKNEKHLEEVKKLIEKITTYIPKIGIFGNSGVGKSSLCNALFGKEIAKISDVEACTRSQQEILIGGTDGKGGIVLVDMPGIGEDPARQQEYTDLYKSLAPKLDLILWAIKADDRNYASGLDAYATIFTIENAPPVVFVITQCEKTNPIREWSYVENLPGETQLSNMLIKENDVSTRFEIDTEKIISVSADCNYNLQKLVEIIVEVLPNEKKYSFTREAKEENVTEKAKENVEKSIWESIKNEFKDFWGNHKEEIISTTVTVISGIMAYFKNKKK
jgi:uncharacterized protein